MAAAVGAAYTLSGRATDAMSALAQAIELTGASEMAGFQALCRLPLSEAQLLAGRLDEAHALAESALTLAREHQERGNEAYAHRLLGMIAVHRYSPHSALAEVHYQQALALAGALGMRPLVAHCHLGLGQLYRQTGQHEQAQVELSNASQLYRVMEMSFWLPQVESAWRVGSTR
jgi:tetratricopeptide (TPR) repeat protein